MKNTLYISITRYYEFMLSMMCKKQCLHTCSGITAAVEFVAADLISNPMGVSRYEIITLITVKSRLWPWGVVITWQKPAVMVNICTSPKPVGSDTIAGRGHKDGVVKGILFRMYMYCLKFVLMFNDRQAFGYFSYENSINIENDIVGWSTG